MLLWLVKFVIVIRILLKGVKYLNVADIPDVSL